LDLGEKKLQATAEYSILRILMIFTHHQMLVSVWQNEG